MRDIANMNELTHIRKALINLTLLRQQCMTQQEVLRAAEARVKTMVPGFDVYYVKSDGCYVLFPYTDDEIQHTHVDIQAPGQDKQRAAKHINAYLNLLLAS